MDKEWERLYEEAMSVLNPHDVSNKMWVGSVASAVLTKKGNIYKGICIDTDGSIGMCAERNGKSELRDYAGRSAGKPTDNFPIGYGLEC